MTLFRPRIDDYKLFYQLIIELDEYHRRVYPNLIRKPSIKTRSKKWFEELISNKDNLVLIGLKGNKSVGLIIAEIRNKKHPILKQIKSVFLDDIFIKDEFKGLGYGKHFINELIIFARKNKVKEIKTKVWSFNKGAIDFYHKLGFKDFAIDMNLTI